MQIAQAAIWQMRDECLLFASFGYMLAGLDDLLVDILWIRRWLRLKLGQLEAKPQCVTELPEPAAPGEIAIFVPAWQEEAVIADMIRQSLTTWQGARFRLYVGCYPNDPGTIDAVKTVHDPQVQLVMNAKNGPTTKADCLNALHLAMEKDEQSRGERFKAVLLHDAEDHVHPDELTICDSMVEHYAFLQFPVLPLPMRTSPWVSGHYLDEFAQGHCRDMVVRDALGVGIPSAGVGCCLRRDVLDKLMAANKGHAFAPDSVTEDYEMGLRLHGMNEPAAFLRIRARDGQTLVATQSHFPDAFGAAIRQKARWIMGISLAGWDRLGWTSSWLENWMRYRDRRAPIAAIVILSGYLGLLLTVFLWLAMPLGRFDLGIPGAIIWMTSGLLVWRISLRFCCVTHHYGPLIGLLSIPRTFVCNAIAVLSARRAVLGYIAMLRSGEVHWDKTAHRSLRLP